MGIDAAQRVEVQTDHVGLNVRDLDRSSAFYRQVLGFDLVAESREDARRYVLLGTEGKTVLTLWERASERFDRERSGLHHLAFQVPSIEDVHEAERRLHELGAVFAYDGIVPHAEGADSGGIFFEDPDGVRLEIFSPTGAGGRPAPVADAPTCGFF